jgi:hypothetical protein
VLAYDALLPVVLYATVGLSAVVLFIYTKFSLKDSEAVTYQILYL